MDYTTGSAFSLNYYLEHGQIPKYSDLSIDDIMDLDDKLRKGLLSLPDMEGTFYRELGFGKEESMLFNGSYDNFTAFTRQFKTGKPYSSNAYMSTSIEEGLYSTGAPYRAFLTIQGKTGKYIEGFSGAPGDKEAIFFPKTKFVTTGTSWSQDRTTFWASLQEET